jgi:hypothetical protein
MPYARTAASGIPASAAVRRVHAGLTAYAGPVAAAPCAAGASGTVTAAAGAGTRSTPATAGALDGVRASEGRRSRGPGAPGPRTGIVVT